MEIVYTMCIYTTGNIDIDIVNIPTFVTSGKLANGKFTIRV